MTTKTSDITDQLEMNFHFWLGDNADTLEYVSEKEFLQRQETVRKDNEDYLNVALPE